MPDITLYLAHGVCSMAAHIILKELFIPFKTVQMVPLPGGGGLHAADGSMTHGEYHAKVHHMGYIPALVVDGTVITENPAVLLYVGHLIPERNLTGASPIENAKVMEWLCWLSGTMQGAGYGAFWRPARYADDEGLFARLSVKGKKTIVKCYERIERVLTGVHAVGDHFSVVDAYLHVFNRWGNETGWDMKGLYANYAVLIENLEQLESAQAALEEEGKASQMLSL